MMIFDFLSMLFEESEGEVFRVRDIEKSMPYAFSMKVALLNHARQMLNQNTKGLVVWVRFL